MKPLQKLLNEPMTRKQFLVRVGVLVFIISGISGTFEKLKHIQKPLSTPKGGSFGGGAYGQ